MCVIVWLCIILVVGLLVSWGYRSDDEILENLAIEFFSEKENYIN